MNNRNVIGLDLAKNVFQLHIADGQGKKIKGLRVRRARLLETFATLSPALVGIEACGSAHYWARELQKPGHEIKMMAPHHVKPYVQGNKTDARDAVAICEAAVRSSVPSVRIRDIDQQQMQALHRTRELWMKQRVATGNQIRGLLAEFGVVIPLSYTRLKKEVPLWLAGERNPPVLSGLIEILYSELLRLEEQISQIENRIKALHEDNAASRLIESIPGIGVLTATAVISAIGDASHYDSGRKLASALGLTPREHSSGESRKQLGISKRGNRYLRTLLIQGARSVLRHRTKSSKGGWIDQLLSRRNFNVAAVALAAKNARRIWAMLQTGELFDANQDEKLRLLKAA
jgi:transposase